jgi:hypothetical protein
VHVLGARHGSRRDHDPRCPKPGRHRSVPSLRLQWPTRGAVDAGTCGQKHTAPSGTTRTYSALDAGRHSIFYIAAGVVLVDIPALTTV